MPLYILYCLHPNFKLIITETIHIFILGFFSSYLEPSTKLKIQGQYVHDAAHSSVPIPFFVGWPLDCYYTIIGWIYPQRICAVNPSTILCIMVAVTTYLLQFVCANKLKVSKVSWFSRHRSYRVRVERLLSERTWTRQSERGE